MLAAEKLQVHYGRARVLHGVDVAIDAGEIVSLLGRNGAGKSTTLKAIMGVVRLSGGSVTHRGSRIDGLSPSAVARRGIAWVPEDRRVFGALTVAENVRVAAQVAGGGIAAAEESLRVFPDLAARLRQRAGSLSGGQQQMLAIARALAARPGLLLLDEPSEGLAPALVRSIREGILAARARGIAILLVEQNLPLALSLCDRCIVLGRGRVAFSGSRAALEAAPDIVAAHLGVGLLEPAGN